jgi:hypothetical protein
MAFRRWDSLWEETECGEIVAEDTARVARAIEAFAQKKGLYLRFREDEFYRELTHLVWLRLRGFRAEEIRGRTVSKPAEWDGVDEAIWIQWIRSYATPDVAWQAEVWDIAFERGESALWEEACPDWRTDVVARFPYWVVRDSARLARIDPTPIEIPDYAADLRAAIEASDANIQRRLK